MKNNIHIWDSPLPVESSKAQVLLWRSYTQSVANHVSVPKLVEDNFAVLKKQYLSWIYDLGEAKYRGSRVIDHLQLRPDLSYWWMTLISEKCNYSTSPQITDAIRLLALNLWSLSNGIDTVRITSGNKELVECVQHWCLARNINFSWDRCPMKKTKKPILKKIYQRLPYASKALIKFGISIWTNWSLRGVCLNEWRQSDADITFFSYLFNLDVSNEHDCGFNSKLWPQLPKKLLEAGCKTNWLHIYCPASSHPTPRVAKRKLEQFNKIGARDQVHVALESFLSFSIICKSLFDWIGILKFTDRLEPTLSNVKCGSINLWPLYKEEWRSSLSGPSSLLSILNLNLFEAAVGMLPKQRIGLYLYEQQAWELGLINAWRKEKHGSLIGVQHSTMLDWDMRYFHDPRNYKRSNNNDLPMPDRVAVNGPAIMEKSLEAGYPKANLFELEALRYLYLLDLKKKNNTSFCKKTDAITLLVLGDYLESNTKIQMGLLEDTLASTPMDISIIVKSHPAHLIDPADYPSIDLKVTRKALEEILDMCDLAYTSPVTSAAVDAYCYGIPVITVLDPNSLNLSPLRNHDGVFFVSSQSELLGALNAAQLVSDNIFEKKEFFTLDSELVRWKKLLLAPDA
jgi:surface carbohydrate biosynthesis protein (TIGR04326 family)